MAIITSLHKCLIESSSSILISFQGGELTLFTLTDQWLSTDAILVHLASQVRERELDCIASL